MTRTARRNETVLENHLKATQKTLAKLHLDGASIDQKATQKRAISMAQLQLDRYKATGAIRSGYDLWVIAEAEAAEIAALEAEAQNA